MTTIERAPARSFVTIPIAPTLDSLVPNQGFDFLRREIRSSYKKLLAELDAELAALGITTDPAAAPARKKRWHW